MSRVQAEDFYKNHQERYFYNRLVTFMSSGPLWVHILARENAIEFWRKLMGPTKVFRTIFDEPDTIRGHFGLSDTRNTTHGSASNRIIGAKDYASIQMNIAEVDETTGRMTGTYKTYAISGALRRMGESDDCVTRLAKQDNIIAKNF